MLNLSASFLYICFFLSDASARKVPVNPTDLIAGVKELKGWSEIAPIHIYKGRELTNFINGGAELYFSYNFKELCVGEYQNSLGKRLTVEIYEMDRSENAYGVYSFDTDGKHPDIGHEATYARGLLKFWKDRFFVRIFSSNEEKGTRDAIFKFGSELADKIHNKGMKPWIVSKIPTIQVVGESPFYFHTHTCLNNFYYLSSENILNLSSEIEAVTYEYELGIQVLRVIVIQYPDTQRAQDTYSNFINAYFFDQPIKKPDLLASSEFIREVEDDKFTGIKLCDNIVILVFEADDEDSLKEILNLQATQFKN